MIASLTQIAMQFELPLIVCAFYLSEWQPM